MNLIPFPEQFKAFKNTRKTKETDPDYNLVVFKENDEGIENIGACWIKEGRNGKFLSCKQSRKNSENNQGTDNGIL